MLDRIFTISSAIFIGTYVSGIVSGCLFGEKGCGSGCIDGTAQEESLGSVAPHLSEMIHLCLVLHPLRNDIESKVLRESDDRSDHVGVAGGHCAHKGSIDLQG